MTAPHDTAEHDPCPCLAPGCDGSCELMTKAREVAPILRAWGARHPWTPRELAQVMSVRSDLRALTGSERGQELGVRVLLHATPGELTRPGAPRIVLPPPPPRRRGTGGGRGGRAGRDELRARYQAAERRAAAAGAGDKDTLH